MSEAAETGVGRWMRRYLKRDGAMIDVGANRGAFTALAAHLVGPSGRVMAFEPAAENAAHLRERFRDVPQVSVVEAAVGDKRGAASLFLDLQNNRQHSLSAANVGKSTDTITVSVVTLDDYISEFRRVHFVKIDAQGADLQVLRGARRLLSTFHPKLVVELWPYGLRNMESDPAQLIEELKALGYDVYHLSPEGGLRPGARIAKSISRPGRWTHVNVAALPRGA